MPIVPRRDDLLEPAMEGTRQDSMSDAMNAWDLDSDLICHQLLPRLRQMRRSWSWNFHLVPALSLRQGDRPTSASENDTSRTENGEH